jgi:UDP-N-acetylglucosamine--N-acetylmuramyl-(pentapeptide) pyrophosphoryl-undecaprenol N-acetylglucosamine transferase
MNSKNTALCFVAGRSGGHIKPALALAKQYRQHNPSMPIIFFSTTHQLDKKIVAESADITMHIALPLENIPRRFWQYPWYMCTLLYCIVIAIKTLYRYKPSLLISMGGYISLPVCIAAILRKIPIHMYELNATPGKATKLLAPLANTIFVCFRDAQQFFSSKKCVHASYPLAFDQSAKISHPQALSALSFSCNRKTILILGGSQGSLFINQLITTWIENNPTYHASIQIIHQAGDHEIDGIKKLYGHYNVPAHVFAYNASIAQFYSAADLIVCRAGAGTLFESIFFQKQCLVIPLETQATDHQVGNAQALQQEYPFHITILRQQHIIENPLLFSHAIQSILNLSEKDYAGHPSGLSPRV